MATPAGRDSRFLAEGLTFTLFVVYIATRSRAHFLASLFLKPQPAQPGLFTFRNANYRLPRLTTRECSV